MSMSSPPPPFSIPTNDYNLHIPQQPQQQQQQQHQNSHSSSSSLSNLSPSIIITLLILSATIIITTCLFLIFRHFQRLSSFFRRCRSQRTVFLTSDHHHHTHHPSTNPTISVPNPNNSSALIDSLPLFSYSSVTRRSSSSDGNDCAVCLSRFKAHDQLRLLPLCCHAFHAQCVDTWLLSNHTCPLCRSNVYASEAEMASIINTAANADRGSNSFRLEIGSISLRRATGTGTGSNSFDARRSYSVGSFDYIVDGESEVAVVSNSDKEETMTNAALAGAQYFEDSSLAADIGGGRSWLGEYMDRLSATVSSRAASFRGSSRRFFSGSSRRSEVAGVGEWEEDSSRVGEEISELFRWASGV